MIWNKFFIVLVLVILLIIFLFKVFLVFFLEVKLLSELIKMIIFLLCLIVFNWLIMLICNCLSDWIGVWIICFGLIFIDCK